MKLTVLGLVALGLIAALAATMLISTLRADQLRREARQAGVTEVEILVASVDLPAMSVVDGDTVMRKVVPADELPEGALTNSVQVIGQILAVPMLEGQAFRRALFASESAGMHLATTLPEGMRAMPVVLSEESGLDRLLYPGCLVDVVASFRVPSVRGGPAGEIISATLLQGVRVLGVNNRSVVSDSESIQDKAKGTTESVRGKLIVTVMVDSRQAETLQMATAHGDVSLAMRNPLDKMATTGSGVLLSGISEDIANQLAAIAALDANEAAMQVNSADDGEDAAAPAEADVAPTGEGAEVADAGETEKPAVEHVPVAPVWTTILIRGNSKETLEFPLPEVEEPEKTSRNTDEDEADPDAGRTEDAGVAVAQRND